MTKKIIFLSIAVATLMASCSSDNEDLVQTINKHNIVMSNSDIEIKLSSSTTNTRSSVESTDKGLFNLDSLGVFSLAKSYLSVNKDELPIDWTPGQEETKYSVWMDNILTKAKINNDSTSTNMNWADGKVRWYPTGNWHGYRFYGYYPYVKGSNLISTSTTRKAKFTTYGNRDIIWGRTEATADDAYCAKYFRSLDHATEIPALTLKHCLMRMTFSCVAESDAYGSYDNALSMGVDTILVRSVPTQGVLTIADYANANNEGTITWDWNNNLKNLALCDKADKPLTTHFVQKEETAIGEGIMLPVPTDVSYKYQIRIILKDKNGNLFNSDYWMDVNTTSQYEAGKSYNVKLIIRGPKTIELTAKLSPWTNDTESIKPLVFD